MLDFSALYAVCPHACSPNEIQLSKHGAFFVPWLLFQELFHCCMRSISGLGPMPWCAVPECLRGDCDVELNCNFECSGCLSLCKLSGGAVGLAVHRTLAFGDAWRAVLHSTVAARGLATF